MTAEEEGGVEVEGGQAGEEEAGEVEEVKPLCLRVLSLTREQQQKHGLRHSDYQRYRGYCSRRLRRIRKAVGLVQGERKKFHKKEVTGESLKDEKHLQIPLVTAERAWAYYMQLKFESNSDPRKKFHMINRLRKARKYGEQLDSLCADSDRVDARTKLETKAYSCWLTGTLYFETSKWTEAKAMLTQAKTIYESLSAAVGEEEGTLFRQKMDDITPSLRYCAYNIGDVSQAEMLALRGGAGGGQAGELDVLISKTREQQAATLQDVEWRGRKMAVKHEKVRLFLLSYQESEQELADTQQEEAKVAVFESLLLDCKDGLQALRDDLLEDPEFRARQQGGEGRVGSQHFLYTYLQYIRHQLTLGRNTVLVAGMRDQLSTGEKPAEGRKVVKAQDIVRMYENMIQNLGEMPGLAGLEEDEALAADIQAKITYYKSFRSFYIAQAFIASQKWGEAMAVFQRSLEYLAQARADPNIEKIHLAELDALEKAIEGKQFVAHANSILETEQATDKMSKLDIATVKSVPLVERLDQYYEDPEVAKGSPNLVNFPPQFSSIPCKPLFYDVALYHVEFPSLEHKLDKADQANASGGLTGWLGGWGWGAKK